MLKVLQTLSVSLWVRNPKAFNLNSLLMLILRTLVGNVGKLTNPKSVQLLAKFITSVNKKITLK